MAHELKIESVPGKAPEAPRPVRKYTVVGRDGTVSKVDADYFEWQASDIIAFGKDGKEVAAFRDWSYFTTE